MCLRFMFIGFFVVVGVPFFVGSFLSVCFCVCAFVRVVLVRKLVHV